MLRLPSAWHGALLVFAAFVLLFTSCGEEEVTYGDNEVTPKKTETAGEATTKEQTSSEGALTPAEATIGLSESTADMPGGGREDPAQSPPEDPPEGVRTYPATTNRNVGGSIAYERKPPTNGDHAPIWQTCGFYGFAIPNETAVHSMDHGAVWITFRSDLPEDQVNILRGLAREDYVLASFYPDQPSPVIATAWRNQLRLDTAKDPRLRQFVDQFRISETAPRSGNGCENGVGDPEP